jgi:hypothetical protein
MTCAFAMDPATRGNSWTLVGAFAEKCVTGGDRIVVAIARQWTGSRATPLSPAVVMGEIAGIVRHYGAKAVFTDQWSSDSIADHGRERGIRVIEQRYTSEGLVELYSNLKNLLATDRLELPPLPILLADLKGVRRRASGSGIRVELSRTANGRHCDFAPSVAMAAQLAPRARRRAEQTYTPFEPPPFTSIAAGFGIAGLTATHSSEFELDAFGRGRPQPLPQTAQVAAFVGEYMSSAATAALKQGK